ncbi:peptidyl-prolyl cis-trans isomerase D [Pseudaminobacter salicylatoxidans]|uniref:Parvulin-like PPIase n=1 Tax=Pseudaminobacter salicylatoxidans TaxID=93369 RepID=A0A316C7B8_PSESE|nr:SurA N-terminal domain-containing protein [Pseudaminobacter salicylatoxidans]PWJ85665.1 peptidyl-prolyl cis-trans isomerase D [Pseudaminobacter salicylatoxidans]
MLDSLRKASGTWVAKLLLLMLVVSFAVWGISGNLVDGNGGGNNVLTVGGTDVTINDYRLAYDRQANLMSQQFGQRLTREQMKAFGLENQVLAQLVAGALLDEQARKMGLGLSKDRLAALTAEDPAFQGPDGRFNRQQFDYVLRQLNMRPDDYFASRSQVAIRQQIVEALSDGLKTPDTFLRAFALYRGEDRTVDYLVLPKSLVEPISAPSNDVLSAWFEEHKKEYAAPEYRKLSYVKLEPEDIIEDSSVSDEQVREEYEKEKARYTTPEERTIQQIVFKSADTANAALDSIRGGATFDKIAAAEGKSDSDILLGTLSKDKIPDKAIADAAFSLAVNEVSPVVQGQFGPVLLRVTEIKPEAVKPLDQVSGEIRKQLALADAVRRLMDVHDAFEDARVNGDSMADAAAKTHLKLVTIDAIDNAAQRPDGSTVETLPQSRQLLQAAFQADVGVDNPPVTVGSSGYVFYEVEDITPARDRTLDEVREKVVADWTKAEAEKRLAAKGEELSKRLKDGTTLETIATELSLEKQTKRGLKREADDGDFGRAGVAATFSVSENGVGVFPSPTGDAEILFKVAEVFEPAGADANSVPEDVRRQFAAGIGEDLLDELVARLQTEYPVQVNQNAINQAQAF